MNFHTQFCNPEATRSYLRSNKFKMMCHIRILLLPN
uniref:Uncharacterized protein n=1 Tax=Arundo donax TaxID=35708 RepID=A0A0A8XWX9_ARUDO